MKKNILIFHEIAARYYFRDLAMAYLGQGHQVSVFCPDSEIHNYRHVFKSGATHILSPNLTRVQEWERSPKEMTRIIKLTNTAEKATGRCFGRVLLAGERDIGRAWSTEEHSWPMTKLGNQCLRDNSLPERVALRYMFFWDKTLVENEFDLVISRTNCSPAAQSLRMLCILNKIPFLSHRFSKVLTGRMFWTEDLRMDNALGKKLYAHRQAEKAPLKQAGIKRLTDFRSTPAPSGYILDNWNILGSLTLLKRHRIVLQHIREALRHYRKGFRSNPPKPILSPLIDSYRIEWCKRAHEKYFHSFTEDELKHLRYILFPLHKEPELMLNYRSPLWHNQRHALKYISSMLPAGYTLLAREHKGNWGRRYKRWLKNVTSFPGTVLGHPHDIQFPYIANADLVITDNGTAGWEGIMLGKPVVTLERTFYDPVGLAVSCKNINKLDESILEALNSNTPDDDRDERICRFIDADYDTTIDAEQAQNEIGVTVDHIATVLSGRPQ